ncbi:MAG: STAS domain-containing protein [Lachnospiraceae bacterium]|nr:STAS domain-containing protein [Lachnospiraceae bacterium]
MQIKEIKLEDSIMLKVKGRVDTGTSPELQQEILKSFQKKNHLILDFEEVDYISSAGLRALLIGQKTANSKGGSMKLVHVCEMVNNILEMSGFINILTIE